jgi:DC-STAMP-like protein
MKYKNVFITKKFHEIDAKRSELKMENVLPLTSSERKSFVEITRFTLLRHEYRAVFEKSVFLLMSSVHLCGIILADYSLFWLLSIVRLYGGHDNVVESEGNTRCDRLTDEDSVD